MTYKQVSSENKLGNLKTAQKYFFVFVERLCLYW